MLPLNTPLPLSSPTCGGRNSKEGGFQGLSQFLLADYISLQIQSLSGRGRDRHNSTGSILYQDEVCEIDRYSFFVHRIYCISPCEYPFLFRLFRTPHPFIFTADLLYKLFYCILSPCPL